MSRKILFLQAPEIHWNANVWFLERFHFSRERMNPSKPVEWVSFKEVNNLENQKILQKYLRYLFGITDLSISTIRIKLLELRTFLVHFNGEEKPIYEVEAEKIQRYLESIQRQDTREKTANGRITMILQFYNFLVVKGYLKKIPFRHEYYLQKEVHGHNDRSVPERVYVEILSKLGNSSGIELVCDVPCRVLEGIDWQIILHNISGNIIFIDEENAFIKTEQFAKAVRESDNYFVLITRENLYNLPYSVEEIYGLHSSGKYQNTKRI